MGAALWGLLIMRREVKGYCGEAIIQD